MLDKWLLMWYNKNVPKREQKIFIKGIGDNYGKENDYCRKV